MLHSCQSTEAHLFTVTENEITEDGEDYVEINIKIKMKSKTFGKVVDKATKFLEAASKFNNNRNQPGLCSYPEQFQLC